MKESGSPFRQCVAVLALVLVASMPAFSQLSSGGIVGTVSDSSGAVIPGVSIKITNTAIGLTREVVSNESGNYRVDQLPIGVYVVEAELSGFKKDVHQNVKVDIDQRTRVDVSLTPGQVTEVVEVTSAAPLVQTEDSSIGQVVEERKIATLPLNGREFSGLAYIVPGAFAPRPGSGLGDRGGFAVAGLNENTNQFLLDGVNNNGTGTMEIAARVNIDAVGEFKVQTGTYAAQYGRYAGAQVDVVTKSGTNEIHGSVFGFLRNDNLDARNFFDPWPLNNLPEFKRLQYGGTMGGPILRDKLFFFGGYQGQRQSQFITTNPSVPLPDFFRGDFSAISGQIRDPQNPGQVFPNNQIPANRLNPIALRFAQFWPAPTRPGLTRNATALLPTPDNFHQPNGKIDWQINSNHRFSGSYNFYQDKLFEWPIAGRPEVPGFMTDGLIKSQGLSFAETWTVTPTMVNEFRAGFGRVRRVRKQQNPTNYNALLGIPGTAADTEAQAYGVPFVTISGFSRIGDNTNMPQPRVDQTWTIADNVSILRGNHALKFGADYFLQQMNLVLFSNGRGNFNFTGLFTGNAMADFVLGLPATTQRQPPLGPLSAHPRRTSINGFFQDDWKIGRNLTLNIGVRYEYTGKIREKYGKLSAFDPAINGGRGGMRLIGNSTRFDNAVATFQRLYPSLTIERGAEQLYKNDANNLAPRFGFAWSPRPATVVRGAYGVFYQIDDLCFCDYYQNPPFNLAQLFTNTATTANPVTLSNPWGTGTATAGPIQMSGIDPENASPYYQQFSLGVQHEVPGGIVLDLSYQGKKGTKLDRARDINQPLNRATGVRPYANFSRVTYLENSASSIYHGLHTRIEKRTDRGESFLLSYIWGKMIDDASTNPQDSYNLQLERALAVDDVRHRFSFSYIYPLPFGNGQKFFNGVEGVASQLISGWELSGITRANTGSPFNPLINRAVSGSGNTGWDRANLIGNPRLDDPTPSGWYNRAAFEIPLTGQFGTAGRNILTGPGAFQVDFSVQKRFRLTERQSIQFRFEAFNALNRANFATPVNNPDSGSAAGSRASGVNFGTIASAGAARQLQLGLKYIF